jgi:hypothetical protein
LHRQFFTKNLQNWSNLLKIKQMITVPEVVEDIVKKIPFLEVGLSRGIVNLSALARMIRPEVQQATYKGVTEGSIVMSLRRLSEKIDRLRRPKKGQWKGHEMIVRSNLAEFTVLNSDLGGDKYKELLRLINVRKGHFFTVTQGIFETTIIASQELERQVEKILSRVKIISRFENLSSITIRLSQETVKIPASYYFILMQLAWSGINVIEVVSTFTEFTVILKDKEVDLAFSALKAMY